MLVSLSDMKSYLGLGAGVTEYDSFLTMQLEIVSEAVEGYCGRKFEQVNYKQTFYREEYPNDLDFKELMLAAYPLVSVSSVKEYLNEEDTIGKSISEYRTQKELSILRYIQGGRFFLTGDIIEVEYSAGFATTPVLIKSVVYSVVQERYNKKINGIDLNFGSDIQRISIPGTIGIDFDYSLQNNERKSHFGTILGNHVNVLDSFRSERAVVGNVQILYVD
jgi:hypothetical protein